MDFQSELAPDMLALIEKWRKRAVSGERMSGERISGERMSGEREI
jgi:hypothetical protein